MKDLFLIIRKDHFTYSQRIGLLYSYLKLRAVRFFFHRTNFFSKKKHISFLGYTVCFNNYNDFYWTFYEVFIVEEYYFYTTTNIPSVLDLGGHIGIATLYFKWLYPESIITTFEPLEENYMLLKANIENNNLHKVKVINKAVRDMSGEISFVGDGRAGKTILDSQDGVMVVSTVSFSKYLSEPVDFCKMDIEGSESVAIMDAFRTSTLKNISHIVLEYHLVQHNSLAEIISFLERSDFKITFSCEIDVVNLRKRNFSHIIVIAKQNI